jgi:HTH-type transcriptional regulator, competence development regulator
MKFGQRVRVFRQERGLSQRALAKKLSVNFTYLSKIENGRLDFGEYPSEELICRIALALEVDEDELLILAKKIPEKIRQRVFERPEVFRALARCDDTTLDRVMAQIRRRGSVSK